MKIFLISFSLLGIFGFSTCRTVELQQCVEPALQIGSKCFQLSDSAMTYNQSKKNCAGNGHMLSWSEFTESTPLQSWIMQQDNELWIEPLTVKITNTNCHILKKSNGKVSNEDINCQKHRKSVCVFEGTTEYSETAQNLLNEPGKSEIIDDYDYCECSTFGPSSTSVIWSTATAETTMTSTPYYEATTLQSEVCFSTACPEPFVQLSTGCYYFSDGFVNLNWWSASEECIRNDALLLTVTNYEVNDDIQSYLRSHELAPILYYIGLSNQGHTEEWVWTTSGLTTDQTGSYWANSAYPANSANENCGAYSYGYNWYWVNVDCSSVVGYICKRPF